MMRLNAYVCATCGQTYPLDSRDWRCACGGLFDLQSWPDLNVESLDTTQVGLWRYRNLLPLDLAWTPVTLGEGNTPLVPVDWDGLRLLVKLESLAPTGSFKDRGAAVLVTALRGLGVQRVVEDSSGNAGASLAAYAARASIGCEVCVPHTAAGPKIAQMTTSGAEVIQIKGRREYAALAAWAAAAHGAYYASHVYSPYFLAGTETMAYELWEQLDRRPPSAVLLPLGNGSLLLGVYHGFQRLHDAGLIARLPRLYAVQAEACAPIYQAFVEGRDSIEPCESAPTSAASIAIMYPARGAQVLAAVRATGGAIVSAGEEEILAARNQLARRGFYVEEAAAAPLAALPELAGSLSNSPEEPIIVPLTGHGLKTSPGQGTNLGFDT